MNELLPYEEQLAGKLADAPLPNEDKGWDAMRKMLDEDDDDGGIVPPVNKGCRTWGASLLLVALLAGIIFIAYKTTNNGKTNAPGKAVTTQDSTLAKTPATPQANPAGTSVGSTAKVQAYSNPKNNVADAAVQNAEAVIIQKVGPGTLQRSNSTIPTKPATGYNAGKSSVVKNAGTPAKSMVSNKSKPVTNNASRANGEVAVNTIPPQKKEQPGTVSDNKNTNNNTQGIQTNVLPGGGVDTVTATTKKDTADKKNIAKNNTQTPAATDETLPKDNKVWFGAGLALQQLIPVDGQKAVPYNAEGRKGSLGDYIPSGYFRVYQNKKFLQVEFKYAAPQYTRDIAYEQKVISHDSGTGTTVSNINHVKKTYYHQLPVSIHYAVLPDLSVGAGFVWNKFQSAVVQQFTNTQISQNPSNPDSGAVSISVPGKVVQLKGDSATAFSKSYFQFMFEAQYTWKRFSLGARYAFGLQPYLTFTSSATGKTQKERNASLNIFLRYELWRSKKK